MTEIERKAKVQDADNKELESIHHLLFDHPDTETWNTTRSLAQPSFLEQIDSYSTTYSES